MSNRAQVTLFPARILFRLALPPSLPPAPPPARVCFRLISSIDHFRSRRPIKLPNMMRSNQPCSQPHNLNIVIDPIFRLLLNYHLLSQADTDELMNERRKMSRPISAWEGLYVSCFRQTSHLVG